MILINIKKQSIVLSLRINTRKLKQNKNLHDEMVQFHKCLKMDFLKLVRSGWFLIWAGMYKL